MPGINVPLDDGTPLGIGACRKCSMIWKLTAEGKLEDHQYRGLLVGTRCQGSGEEPWDYRG